MNEKRLMFYMFVKFHSFSLADFDRDAIFHFSDKNIFSVLKVIFITGLVLKIFISKKLKFFKN